MTRVSQTLDYNPPFELRRRPLNDAHYHGAVKSPELDPGAPGSTQVGVICKSTSWLNSVLVVLVGVGSLSQV
jgi:hypothetical protein